MTHVISETVKMAFLDRFTMVTLASPMDATLLVITELNSSLFLTKSVIVKKIFFCKY